MNSESSLHALIEVGTCFKSYYIVNSNKVLGGLGRVESGATVKFCNDGVIFLGKVIEFSRIEKDLELSKRAKERIPLAANQWYLIQYSTSANNFTHEVVHNKYLCNKEGDNLEKKEVSIKINGAEYDAKVLYVSDSEEDATKQLWLLKRLIVDHYIHDPFLSDEFIWLLVSYTSPILSTCYAVVNCHDSIWRQPDQFEDVMGFLNDPDSKIIKKSANREELLRELINLEMKWFGIGFPLRNFEEDDDADVSMDVMD